MLLLSSNERPRQKSMYPKKLPNRLSPDGLLLLTPRLCIRHPYPPVFLLSASLRKVPPPILSLLCFQNSLFLAPFLRMGTIFSSTFTDPNSASSLYGCFTSQPPSSRPNLGDLPESCVASILAYLDPPEICKFAQLNRAFCGASWADFVWESKLPVNYEALMQRLMIGDDCPRKLAKREIYARLCGDNTFDGGTKKAWLDKSTGGFCLSISSKGLTITGIDDRRYWNHIPTEESKLDDEVQVDGDLFLAEILQRGFLLSLTFSKFGGLRLMEKLSSPFQQEHIVYSSGCN